MHHGKVTPDIAKGLLALRKLIDDAKIPPSKLDETINVAVWNIREFGKKKRTLPAIHYIAEILNQFDLIALVELRNDLTDLGRVLTFLGPTWQVVYSDWIDDPGGNDERVGFLFDRRAATFNGLAAEVDAPRAKKLEEFIAAQSFWRAPYMCSFRSGNFDFIAIATHTRWGHSLTAREAELQTLANWIDTRFKSQYAEDTDLIVMGDFNIPKIGDKLFTALTSRGLEIPDGLKELRVGDRAIGGSNVLRNARFDQILHLPTMKSRFTNLAGTLDFLGDKKTIDQLFPGAGYTLQKFTFQLSDHFPVWAQIKVDIDGQRLTQIIQDAKDD
jgi:endonuclease/exonuclease/phosphatase family protein